MSVLHTRQGFWLTKIDMNESYIETERQEIWLHLFESYSSNLCRKGNFATIILIFILNTVQFNTCVHVFCKVAQDLETHQTRAWCVRDYVTMACYYGTYNCFIVPCHRCCKSSGINHINKIRGRTDFR